jgi:hypothetical protein
MSELLAAMASFPGFIPTILLGVVLVLGLISMLGVFDLSHGGHDLPHDMGHDLSGGIHVDHADGSASDLMTTLGFKGVPIFIVIALIASFWWVLTIGALLLLSGLLPGEALAWLIKSAVLIAAFLLSVRLAALVAKPLRPIFNAQTGAASPVDFIGRPCKITTGTVDEKFGQAEVVIDQGAPHRLQVWARTPNTMERGSQALILNYDEARKRYEVESYEA